MSSSGVPRRSELYPDGLPEPWSDDPTQWLFEGRPEVSTSPLQVAVGRSARLSLARTSRHRRPRPVRRRPTGSCVCPRLLASPPPPTGSSSSLPPPTGTAGHRRMIPRAAWPIPASRRRTSPTGSATTSSNNTAPCSSNGPSSGTSGTAARTASPPWSTTTVSTARLWNGSPTSTSAPTGSNGRRADIRNDVAGADARLAAALDLQKRLELILEGEPLRHLRPLEGRSMSSRSAGIPTSTTASVSTSDPSPTAKVLRSEVKVHWKKDRGKNPDGTERHNDLHHTLTTKRESRNQAGVS